MKALPGLLLLVFGHGVSSVIHSLQYFATSSTGLPTFPEFVAVAMVDGVQFGYYDRSTQGIVLKQAWKEQFNRDHPGELEMMSGMALGAQQRLKAKMLDFKKLFNQTGGAHMVQYMFSCEWDDEDDSTDGYLQYGYDGEDFIALDLKTLTWVAAVPQAFSTKQRWDEDKARLQFNKFFFTKQCVDWLKMGLAYGKSTLQRTERPRVSLLQRSPSSPVVCHATGFYPDRVGVFWRRDGQELHEQVDPGEVLPNHDGTFQVSVGLNLTAVPQEDWGRYECVVQLKGIEDISTPLDPALIRTNWEDQSGLTIPIIIGFVVLLLAAAAAAVVGVLLYKKRNGSDTSSENTEGQNPAPEAQPLTTRYAPRHATRRIGSICSRSHLPNTPIALPNTPIALPNTPIALPDTPIALPDTPIALPDTPIALPDTPIALPDTPIALPDTPIALPDTPIALPDTPIALQDTPIAHSWPLGMSRSRPIRSQRTNSKGFLVSASDAGVGVTSLWIISSSCSSEYIDMKALTGLLLLVFGHGVSSVLHSMQYFYTGSSGLTTFPEFVAVGMVDGVQFNYYDSNTQRTVLKQDWMERYTIRQDPDYLERTTGMSNKLWECDVKDEPV
ncbi:unnamed protein product [Gadus morhua 'NCC']